MLYLKSVMMQARSELLKMLHSVKLQPEVQWKPKEKESTELQMPIRL